MPSNFWEEQRMGSDVANFHEKMMEEMHLPEWVKEIGCPFCHKQLPLRSVRNIQICFNARNFGEIAVEVHCDFCNKMDTVYFRTTVRKVSDFVDYLTGYLQVSEHPVVEKEMYDQKYNCIIDEMLNRRANQCP